PGNPDGNGNRRAFEVWAGTNRRAAGARTPGRSGGGGACRVSRRLRAAQTVFDGRDDFIAEPRRFSIRARACWLASVRLNWMPMPCGRPGVPPGVIQATLPGIATLAGSSINVRMT